MRRRLREATAFLALVSALSWTASAAEVPPSKGDLAPPSGSDGESAPPPAQGAPNKGGTPEPQPTPPAAPTPAPQTPAPQAPAKKKPARPPKAPAAQAPAPEKAHHPHQAAQGAPAASPAPETLQELASASSVKAAALAALLRMQDRLKRAQALEDQADVVSPQERTTGSVGDQLRMMAAELRFNVPEVGSAAIEADRLRQQSERLPGGQPGSRRHELRQASYDLQQLANQMQGVLDQEKAEADRLAALAGPAP